jgi:hypothetical protein
VSAARRRIAFLTIALCFAPPGRAAASSYLDIWFEDDPLITPARRESARTDPVISIVTLKKDRDGTLTFQQDIRLEPN